MTYSYCNGQHNSKGWAIPEEVHSIPKWFLRGSSPPLLESLEWSFLPSALECETEQVGSTNTQPQPHSFHSPHCLSDSSQPALHTFLDHCPSNVHMYTNQREMLLKCRLLWIGLGWSLKVCIFNKLSNNTDAAGGLGTTFWVVWF